MPEEITTPTGHHGDRSTRNRINELKEDCNKVSDPNIQFTNDDLVRKREVLELDLREEKARSQRKMAWMAMITMTIFTLGLFIPVFPDTRINALGEVLGLFYVAQAGVVGAYMGFTTWMSRR